MAGKTVDLASAEAGKEGAGKYDRSTIAFPYTDLKDAFSVVDSIHENAGTECSVDQLAAYLKHSARSGAFRLKLSTARVFGLIETVRGTVSLTPLGRRATDPGLRGPAGRDAFYKVPLYLGVFQKYTGLLLPPPAALEREMASLGVAKKQTQKARQAFERSAEQAGFFGQGPDRLVEPKFRDQPAPQPLRIDPKPMYGGDGGGGGNLHPFIVGLLKSLPAPDTVWPEADRQKWLQTAENVFSLMYKSGNDSAGDEPTE